ncbi:MAG: redoxin domain-containing protein [Calditrichaeota bacterium]|nr:redoxin domain-containing protein [Calditrichota bacterium]
MRALVVLLIATLFLPVQTGAGTHLAGSVLGANGDPLPMAHVHLLSYRGDIRKPLRTVAADREGRFALVVDEPGMYRLLFTGVDHDKVSVPLLLVSEAPEIRLSVRLAPLAYKEHFEVVRIVGDWNGFTWEAADTMRAQPDGTFLYERTVTGDTIAYQLFDITKEARTVNGTSADYYAYDGGGDYVSVLRVRDGRARIVFAPSKLLRVSPEGLPAVDFLSGGRALQAIWAIDDLLRKEQQAFQAAAAAYSQSHQDMRDFHYDWSPTVARLKQWMGPEQELLVRQFAGLRITWLVPFRARIDSTTQAEIAELLPPSSPIWGLEPQAALVAHRDPQQQELFAHALVAENPDHTVRAVALAFLASMAQLKGDSAALAARYALLQQEYNDVPEVQYYLKSLNPARRIARGKAVPDFAVQLMDGGQTLTNKDLLGKYYLLDFWATWCGPCIGEMPHLHAAYERCKDKNFAILSLSLDRRPEDVTAFREKRWPMPWLHAFLTGGFQNELVQSFEVLGIPRPILVGPSGTIVEVEERLRGAGLLTTHAKYLGP